MLPQILERRLRRATSSEALTSRHARREPEDESAAGPDGIKREGGTSWRHPVYRIPGRFLIFRRRGEPGDPSAQEDFFRDPVSPFPSLEAAGPQKMGVCPEMAARRLSSGTPLAVPQGRRPILKNLFFVRFV
jgi:hypothetical protein